MMKRERDRIEAAIVNALVVITIRQEGGREDQEGVRMRNTAVHILQLL